jgi:hypothetical protein
MVRKKFNDIWFFQSFCKLRRHRVTQRKIASDFKTQCYSFLTAQYINPATLFKDIRGQFQQFRGGE